MCNPRKNALLKDGNKSDRIDARKLAELLRGNQLKSVYHGESGVRMLRELSLPSGAGQRHQADHGASDASAQDGSDYIDSVKEGRKLRRRKTKIASRLSVSGEE